MSEAFFEVRGPGRFRATELTRGPWDPGLQHAGPPAALLGRAGEAEVMRATALRIRTVELDLPAGLTPGPRLPGPDAGRTMPFFPTGQEVGYHTAMELRFVAGSFLELGPATVWM